MFDMKTQKWTMINKLNSPRYGTPLLTLNGKLTMLGGGYSGSEIFDGSKWNWNSFEYMHAGYAAIVVPCVD